MIAIYKRLGETPLEALNRLRSDKPELALATLSYAGRLDPMAEGILLVLVGEENKDRAKYLNLDKTYEAEVLFGIETDTYDILGKIQAISDINKTSERTQRITKASVETALAKFHGQYELTYPPYSSKTVEGKPLFQWAREGKLNEITLPSRTVTIFSTKVHSLETISSEKLREQVQHMIKKVTGDFRQEEILALWQTNLKTERNFFVAKIEISCSSGTYIRSIAHEVGKLLNTEAIALSIKRTKIGEFTLNKINKELM